MSNAERCLNARGPRERHVTYQRVWPQPVGASRRDGGAQLAAGRDSDSTARGGNQCVHGDPLPLRDLLASGRQLHWVSREGRAYSV